MSLQNFVVGVVAVVALIVGVAGYSKEAKLGAFSGPDVYSYLTVFGPFTQGGDRVVIDPVDAAYTLTAGDLDNASVITFLASTTQPALTLTLTASSTFPLPKQPGTSRTWVIENPFTAAATTTTIAAGTGIDLQEPDGQNVVIGVNNYAFLNCVRGADSGAPQDIVCSVDETIPAD